MGKVTQEELDKLVADFNTLLEDVLIIVPHSSRLALALMMFRMAEQDVVFLASQSLNS